MPLRVRLSDEATQQVDWAALRAELQIVEEFTPQVVECARHSEVHDDDDRIDLTDQQFFTIDPPGSMDLDQAMYLEQRDGGFVVHYAIADVAAFVAADDIVDREAHVRGETFYCPDARVPLYPTVISEDKASLLPEQRRPAVSWKIGLDQRGEIVSSTVKRAWVRSGRRLAYEDVPALLATDPQLALLRTIGTLRQESARRRGAIDLHSPEQLVSEDSNGRLQLTLRADNDAEGWNEQISLVTGIAAARLMVDAGVGLLRTLPEPDAGVMESIRLSATALGIAWPSDKTYGEIIDGLDIDNGKHAALMTESMKLLRGAAYTVIDGQGASTLVHTGVASIYAHCTAPLRRLADRYVNEVCLALCNGHAIPEWASGALPALPSEMAAADRKAHALERAIVDAAEAAVLQQNVGDVFSAVVVAVNAHGATVQIADPAVRARCVGVSPNDLGNEIEVRLDVADVATRTIEFARI